MVEASIHVLEDEGVLELSRCPRRPSPERWLHLPSGEIVPTRCGSHLCPWCGLVNARATGRAIALAEPERFFTFTQVGESWPLVRGRMKRMRYALTKGLGYEVHWCWHCEPNPAGTGHHVHAWQYGDYVPLPQLRAVARREGVGSWVHASAAAKPENAMYGMKLSGWAYGIKEALRTETRDQYLAANGGRLVHSSRGFWRGRVASEQAPRGERLTLREAQRVASAAARGEQPAAAGEWVRTVLADGSELMVRGLDSPG